MAVSIARAWACMRALFTAHLRLNGSCPVPVTPSPNPTRPTQPAPRGAPPPNVLSQHNRMQMRAGPQFGDDIGSTLSPVPRCQHIPVERRRRDSSHTGGGPASLLRRRFSDRRAALWAGPTCAQGRVDTLSRGDLDHGTPVDPSQGRAGQGRAAKKMISVLRHPSFERGPPTHYYMDLLVLIFNVLMGIGVFTRV